MNSHRHVRFVGYLYREISLANTPMSAYCLGMAEKQCGEAELLWTTCLKAGIAHRDSEKRELLSLMRRDPQFRRFEDEIKLAWNGYASAKSDLAEHLVNHCCWNH
jgi:hypothetical protein